MQWYKSYEKSFHCKHINKCDVLIAKDGEVYVWNTDLPEPIGEFLWVFVNDLLENECLSPRRTYIPCDCQPERLSEKTSKDDAIV